MISMREDFPEEVRKTRKELVAEIKTLRKEGKTAFMVYDKLVVREIGKNQNHKSQNKRALSESPQTKTINFNKKFTLSRSTFDS